MNYDTTVSSTALVFTRFIILEWIRRKNSNYHSLGEIFFICYDDVRDIELSDALDKLVSIIMGTGKWHDPDGGIRQERNP